MDAVCALQVDAEAGQSRGVGVGPAAAATRERHEADGHSTRGSVFRTPTRAAPRHHESDEGTSLSRFTFRRCSVSQRCIHFTEDWRSGELKQRGRKSSGKTCPVPTGGEVWGEPSCEKLCNFAAYVLKCQLISSVLT